MRVELFLGYPLTESLKEKIEKIDSRLYSMFINDSGPYLKLIDQEDQLFLGKQVGTFTDMPKMKLFEANIYSILAKIIPDFPFKNESLLLFATHSRE